MILNELLEVKNKFERLNYYRTNLRVEGRNIGEKSNNQDLSRKHV